MICVSVDALDFDFCESVLRKHQLIEFRLERSSMSLSEIKELFAMPKKMIAVCRSNRMDDNKKLKLLLTAIDAGAMYVDVEYDAKSEMLEEIKKLTKKSFCKLIISYHNYDSTPPNNELITIINKCFDLGADIVKVACKSNSEKDNLNLIMLYNTYESGKLISIGMGSIGKITRLAAPSFGAPFTYASLEKDLETAPGQIDLNSMKKIYELMK
jgi:3-dehydroquinate dehydratase-1